MALLQIAEPGMSAAPHQHRLAIGIDLGTTNSLVATVRNGVSDVIMDEQDRILLPSVVRYYPDGTVEVGHEAREKQSEDPSNTIVSVKRFMGRSLKDVSALSNAHYNFIDAPGMVKLNTVVGEKSPVEISSDILKVMKTRAESALGGELAGVVITVPAYFDDAQRQATKDAARLAGLTVLRLLNEPTAAAVAYGLDNGSEGIYAIYDLGGGTFDISVLRLRQGVFEVLSTNGNSALGGDDFDECIYHWLLEQVGLKEIGPNDSRLLLAKARHGKEMLTESPSTEISATLSTGQAITATLTREIFATLTKALVDKTLLSTRKALRDANLQTDEIDGVVMVGGSTRMLSVREAVKDFFGRELLTNLDPDKVVALGAAVQANILVGNRSADEMLLLDVIPLSLGIETMGGLVEKIIPRNSTIPVAMAQDFTTYKDGQTAMSVHVAQGERELVADCRSLAKFELRGIPPMVAGAARIRVTFQVDADGLVSVTAREQSTGVESNVVVKPSYGLSDEEITKMLSDSQQNAQVDMAARMLREQQIEAIRLLEATEAALAEDGDALLSPEERGVIEKAMDELRQIVEGVDLPLLKKTTESLNQITTQFAALRMNHSVQKALTGFKVDDLEVETLASNI